MTQILKRVARKRDYTTILIKNRKLRDWLVFIYLYVQYNNDPVSLIILNTVHLCVYIM